MNDTDSLEIPLVQKKTKTSENIPEFSKETLSMFQSSMDDMSKQMLHSVHTLEDTFLEIEDMNISLKDAVEFTDLTASYLKDIQKELQSFSIQSKDDSFESLLYLEGILTAVSQGEKGLLEEETVKVRDATNVQTSILGDIRDILYEFAERSGNIKHGLYGEFQGIVEDYTFEKGLNREAIAELQDRIKYLKKEDILSDADSRDLQSISDWIKSISVQMGIAQNLAYEHERNAANYDDPTEVGTIGAEDATIAAGITNTGKKSSPGDSIGKDFEILRKLRTDATETAPVEGATTKSSIDYLKTLVTGYIPPRVEIMRKYGLLGAGFSLLALTQEKLMSPTPDEDSSGIGANGSLLGFIGKGLSSLAGNIGPAALVGGIIWSVFDGIQGYFKSEEWGVSKVAGAVGAALGGLGEGASGAVGNGAKWAMIGMGLGTAAAPGIGTIAGAILGAGFGAVLGYIGGEDLAKKLDPLMSGIMDGLFKSIKIISENLNVSEIMAGNSEFLSKDTLAARIGGSVGNILMAVTMGVDQLTKDISSSFKDFFTSFWDPSLSLTENLKNIAVNPLFDAAEKVKEVSTDFITGAVEEYSGGYEKKRKEGMKPGMYDVSDMSMIDKIMEDLGLSVNQIGKRTYKSLKSDAEALDAKEQVLAGLDKGTEAYAKEEAFARKFYNKILATIDKVSEDIPQFTADKYVAQKVKHGGTADKLLFTPQQIDNLLSYQKESADSLRRIALQQMSAGNHTYVFNSAGMPVKSE